MTSFVDRITESERWVSTVGHYPGALSEGVPGEHAITPEKKSLRSRREAMLASIVRNEILPRLSSSQRQADTATRDVPSPRVEHDIQAFMDLLLTRDASAAVAFIDALRRNGATPASLYLGIVTLAARCLGELWQEDRCGFDQVAISMGHLQIVLRSLSPHFQMQAVRRAQTESVLLAPAPGEQHSFGLLMLAEFFRREGWHVAGGPLTSVNDAVSIVRGTWIDIAGFSIGSAMLLDELAACIRRVRRGSCNPNLYVMVGGPLFLTRPDLAEVTGADMAANDATEAVRHARGLLANQAAAAD